METSCSVLEAELQMKRKVERVETVCRLYQNFVCIEPLQETGLCNLSCFISGIIRLHRRNNT